MRFRDSTGLVVEAVRFGGSSTHAGALRLWVEGGTYRDPVIVTSDLRNFELPGGGGTVRPRDWVVREPSGVFRVVPGDEFTSRYTPA